MSTNTESVKAFETVERFFQERGWKFTRDSEKQVLRMVVAGDYGQYVCYAHVVDERPLVLFHSTVSVRVPEEKRPAVAEYLTRANWCLWLGNFEMDYSDGEVRYKTGLDVRDGELTMGMVGVLVFANLQTMDRYFPGMMSVIWSDISPEAAVAKAEGRRSEEPWPWETPGVRRFG